MFFFSLVVEEGKLLCAGNVVFSVSSILMSIFESSRNESTEEKRTVLFGYKNPSDLNLLKRDSERSNSMTLVHTRDLTTQYDCCMVFEIDNKETDGLSAFAKRYIRKLTMNNLDVFIVSSGKYNFVLIRASLSSLRRAADTLQFRMLLDPKHLKLLAEQGDTENGIQPIQILHDSAQSRLWPYDYIYAPYEQNFSESLYWKREDMTHPFRSSVRFKIIQAMISSKPPDGSYPIKIRSHVLKKNIVAFYPLHKTHRLQRLKDTWLSIWVPPMNQPFDDIKVLLLFMLSLLLLCG
jgi:hypothetical protein